VYEALKYALRFYWVVTPCSVEYGGQRGPPKRRYPTSTLHGFTTQLT